MKGYLVPFIGALVAFSVMFLAFDYAMMGLQGLSLIYHP
jgi:hypothetical protein